MKQSIGEGSVPRAKAAIGGAWAQRVAGLAAAADKGGPEDVPVSSGDDEPLRAFLLSWDEPARDRLRERCRATGVIEVVGFGRDLRSTIRLLRENPVDVVIAELDAARGAPAGVVSILRSILPDGRIVVWGDDVSYFEDAFDAGADAWVSRAATPGTLAAAATGRHIAGSAR